MFSHDITSAILVSQNNRELKQRRWWWQQERQKSNRLRLAKQQLCTCIMLFVYFFAVRTTTWKCLISLFVEDVNTREQLSFSFPELQYSLLEFNCRKICQHLTNWTRWIKHNKVWSRASSLFKWCFHMRRLPCCLSSLMKH